MYKNFIWLLIICQMFNCKQKEVIDASQIINKSIEVSGGERIKNSVIAFDFRDKHYKAIRNKGKFQLERTFKDSIGVVKDVLDNSGFQRFIDTERFDVSDERGAAYSNSVNAVHYFSVLPYSLDGIAVNKNYLSKRTLKGHEYYKIKVTFNQNGGGEGFEDVFVYWVNLETFKVDYLAYSYIEDGEKGLRFREAYNERYVKGIRFVDYNNYKPKNTDIRLHDLDSLYEMKMLDLLSKIELKNIEVL